MNLVAKYYWVISTQMGIDPRIMLLSARGLFRYVQDLIKFRTKYIGRMELMPCLHDRYAEGGTTKSEYFWQDLLVARRIFDSKPEKHVDIGSRIDGFVAHVASFREIEVLDVRPITTQIPGVKFKQADLMEPIQTMEGYCDSVSCLHALEHFGLGRYGDPIRPDGFKSGLVNMASLLHAGGTFYLSVPIGLERVEFNANRVFDPRTIIVLANQNKLVLVDLTIIQPGEDLLGVTVDMSSLEDWANQRYALGIFTFKKTH